MSAGDALECGECFRDVATPDRECRGSKITKISLQCSYVSHLLCYECAKCGAVIKATV